MIVLRNRPQLRILSQVLEIGLHNGSARRQKLDQVFLPHNHAIDYLIHRGRGREIGCSRLRWSRLGRRDCLLVLRRGRRLLGHCHGRNRQQCQYHPLHVSHNSHLQSAQYAS